MKKMNVLSRLLALTLLSGFFVLSACGDDDDGGTPEPTQNVWEIINGRSDLSGLAAELNAAGLSQFLQTSTAVTVFAPNNTALNTLLGTLGIDDFSDVRADVVQSVLTYHAVAQTLTSDQVVPNTVITTVQGETIQVVDGPALSSGATTDATFVTVDLLATNGAVHVINNVLVPPTIGDLIVATLGTVAQPIYLAADYTTLVEAITKADAGKPAAETIFNFLTTADNVTVFGPPNQVFDIAQIGIDDFTAEQWDGILRSHVVAQTLAPLENAANIATVSGLPITTFAPDGAGFLGQVQGPNNAMPIDLFSPDPENTEIVDGGIPAGNGVLYILAGIIM